MTFKTAMTFAISGPNKLPRFQRWHREHAAAIDVSLPPQVPVKSETMTIRVKSPEARQALLSLLSGTKL